jgi:LPS sulfotransferase NodH
LNVAVVEDAPATDFDRRYIEAVVKEGRGGTDTFGLRLMRESVDQLSTRLGGLFPGLEDDRARFEAAFGPMLFIHLSRADKVSQAVSRVKAMQTGLWHVAADDTERERTSPGQEAVYDRDCIGRYVEELTAQDQAWNHWFLDNRIEPLRLTYEALAPQPKGALEIILSALGHDPSIAATVEPRTAKMSDPLSRNWASRFRAETGDLPT